MTISATTGAQATTSAATTTTSATGNTPQMDQNQFLQLLVAQLKNQDPLQPTDSTQFVTQLAQFSQVEQAVTQTQTLGTIQQQLTGLNNDQATALVGKTVTIGGKSVSFDGSVATPAAVTLAGAASSVTATITDANGNPVRTISLGAEGAGPLSINWDGKTDAGQTAPAGSYSISVTAAGSNGAPVAVSQNVTGTVTSVSFANGYPTISLGNGVQAPVSSLVSVGASPTTP